ncbi:MAG: DnaJ domain-containing protein [Chloroflexi bacterium]|nr:DnaJ domain-containing protein [Chloroflexota bacterium]
MATQFDYYRILQVHPGAEKEVINAAYRQLASKYHPDVSRVSDAAERMKQINIAYEVLSDPAKRAEYDAAHGGAHSPDTPPHAAPRPQYPSKAQRTLLITVGLMILAGVLFRLVPVLLLLVLRIVVPLAVIALVVWFLFTLAKPRG